MQQAEAKVQPWDRPLDHGPWTCPAHGQYGGETLSHMRGCPDCTNAAAEAERAWRTAWGNYLFWERSSGIPWRFRTRTRTNWRRQGKSNELIGRAVDQYADNLSENIEAGRGLIFLGNPGLGKTHLLAALAGEAIARSHRAIYAVWPDVVCEVKNNFNASREDRRDLIGILQEIPLLALDELALKNTATDFEHGLLFELIDYRYRERLPTLAATNATLDTFPNVVGERIADRLTECAPPLVLTGQSQRIAAATSADIANATPQLERPPEVLVCRVHRQGRDREQKLERPDY